MEPRVENPGTQSLPTPDALPFIPEPAVAKPPPDSTSRERTPPSYDANWLLQEVRFLRKAIFGLIIGIAVIALLFGVMHYLAAQERNTLRDELRTLKSDSRSLEDRFNLLVDLMITERDTPAK
jgi:hypothetical protein